MILIITTIVFILSVGSLALREFALIQNPELGVQSKYPKFEEVMDFFTLLIVVAGLTVGLAGVGTMYFNCDCVAPEIRSWGVWGYVPPIIYTGLSATLLYLRRKRKRSNANPKQNLEVN